MTRIDSSAVPLGINDRAAVAFIAAHRAFTDTLEAQLANARSEQDARREPPAA